MHFCLPCFRKGRGAQWQSWSIMKCWTSSCPKNDGNFLTRWDSKIRFAVKVCEKMIDFYQCGSQGDWMCTNMRYLSLSLLLYLCIYIYRIFIRQRTHCRRLDATLVWSSRWRVNVVNVLSQPRRRIRMLRRSANLCLSNQSVKLMPLRCKVLLWWSQVHTWTLQCLGMVSLKRLMKLRNLDDILDMMFVSLFVPLES